VVPQDLPDPQASQDSADLLDHKALQEIPESVDYLVLQVPLVHEANQDHRDPKALLVYQGHQVGQDNREKEDSLGEWVPLEQPDMEVENLVIRDQGGQLDSLDPM